MEIRGIQHLCHSLNQRNNSCIYERRKQTRNKCIDSLRLPSKTNRNRISKRSETRRTEDKKDPIDDAMPTK